MVLAGGLLLTGLAIAAVGALLLVTVGALWVLAPLLGAAFLDAIAGSRLPSLAATITVAGLGLAAVASLPLIVRASRRP